MQKIIEPESVSASKLSADTASTTLNPSQLSPLHVTKPTQSSAAGPLPSPGVQQKIEEIEKQAGSVLSVEPSIRLDKRKSEGSPEVAELSKKEKKILREEEKRQNKLSRKLEYKEKNTLKLDSKNSH